MNVTKYFNNGEVYKDLIDTTQETWFWHFTAFKTKKKDLK